MKSSKYDWRNIPDWVQYIAIDSYGNKCAFEREPHHHIGGFWASYTGESCLIEEGCSCENWDGSLEKRPEVLGTKEDIETMVKLILQQEENYCGDELRCSAIASKCAEQLIELLKLKP